MHDEEWLDCGHYGSDVSDSNTRMWFHCDDHKITEISDFTEDVYTIKRHKR